MTPVDLRSDTVTRPTDAMREAMRAADVGDDVYGEDPTVDALQRLADIDGPTVLGQHTNMVFVDVPVDRLRALDAHLRDAGIRISIGTLPTLCLATHLDIDDAGIERTVDAFARFCAAR